MALPKVTGKVTNNPLVLSLSGHRRGRIAANWVRFVKASFVWWAGPAGHKQLGTKEKHGIKKIQGKKSGEMEEINSKAGKTAMEQERNPSARARETACRGFLLSRTRNSSWHFLISQISRKLIDRQRWRAKKLLRGRCATN